NSRYAKDHKKTEGSRVLYCIVLSLKALRLDRKVLDTVKVCRNGIHEYLRILELRKCICDLRIDQAACGDHRKPRSHVFRSIFVGRIIRTVCKIGRASCRERV